MSYRLYNMMQVTYNSRKNTGANKTRNLFNNNSLDFDSTLNILNIIMQEIYNDSNDFNTEDDADDHSNDMNNDSATNVASNDEVEYDLITMKSAIKKYKITENDIINYLNDNNVSIFQSGKSIKYLVSDIEKIALLKHNTTEGQRFVKKIKRSDEITNELLKLKYYMWNNYCPGCDVDICELEKKLLNDDDLNVNDVIKNIYINFKKIEKLSKLIDTLILGTVCQPEMITELCEISADDFKKLKGVEPRYIFNELTHTEAYEKLKSNFNYDIFNEVTILKVSFIDVFADDIKHIIKKKIEQVHKTLRFNEFDNLVAITIKNKPKFKRQLSKYNTIKDNFIFGKINQSEAFDLLCNIKTA